jgi:transcriptional regulator with XRE-family HTH domain
MDERLARHIGVEARRARHALRLTQEDIAERVGVSLEFYSRLERGGTLPSVPTLVRLVSALEVSADILLGRVDTTPAPLVAADSAGASETSEPRRILRRIVRRLEESDVETLELVNQWLLGLARWQESRVRSRRQRRTS